MKNKIIIYTTFLIFGVVCFLTGGYFGITFGSSISESVVFAKNHEYQKSIYACGKTGDITCFKQHYDELASYNIFYANTLISQDISGMFGEELKTIKKWNQKVINEAQ